MTTSLILAATIKMLCCSSKSLKRNQGFDLYILSQKFRFSAQELLQYQSRFNRISKGKDLTLKKFRKSMGILGLQSTSALADRIFHTMDKNNNSKVNFEEYLSYMDIVIYGTKDEKLMQSFYLISQNNDYITYLEFSAWVKNITEMSSNLTGSFVIDNDERIKCLFESIDLKKDGLIDIQEFKLGARKHLSQLSLFDFASSDDESEKVQEHEMYRNRLESIDNNLKACIEIVKEKNVKRSFEPVVEVCEEEFVPERGPKCISQSEFGHKGDQEDDFDIMDGDEVKEEDDFVVLTRLKQLSIKVQSLKTDQNKGRRATLFNIPKVSTEIKKKNKISWGDEDWNLILYMMLGIQKSLKISRNPPIASDFEEVNKFDLITTKKQGSNKAKFTDFAPLIFAYIRYSFFIEDKVYIKSLGVEKIMSSLIQSEFSSLVGLISSGKSGSFFYFSDDGNYVLKTMSSDEFSFFRVILPEYFTYITTNTATLIPKFFGFHNIKYYMKTKKLKKDFIIMENLFSSGFEIHMRFDLKGSIVGRTTDASEDFSVARKDLDFNRANIKIRIGEEKKRRIIEQIRKDCEFFERLNIIDYSLLVGIHKLKGKKISLAGLKNAYMSTDMQELYFIGIIDVLTLYNTKKKLENAFKSPFLGGDISCIPPKPYAARFFNYIQTIFE